jgi:hypothetical protein
LSGRCPNKFIRISFFACGKSLEDLVGEDFLEDLVMETTDTVKSIIWGCASFGNQDMDMGMEVDAITESSAYTFCLT